MSDEWLSARYLYGGKQVTRFMVKVYLDTCVWGRPFDDQRDEVIKEETAAFFEILLEVDLGNLEVVASDVLFAELEDISDESKRDRIKGLALKAMSRSVPLAEKIKEMAQEIERACKTYGVDSLHLASAVAGDAEHFITTDYELLGKKRCIKQKIGVDVINPMDFMRKLSWAK